MVLWIKSNTSQLIYSIELFNSTRAMNESIQLTFRIVDKLRAFYFLFLSMNKLLILFNLNKVENMNWIKLRVMKEKSRTNWKLNVRNNNFT